jgi:glutamyl-tRNA reductase
MSHEIFVVGVSHRTAPLAIREKLAVSEEDLPETLGEIRAYGGIEEAMFLSTCNRVELYGTSPNPSVAIRWARNYFHNTVAKVDVGDHLYER